ncbi:MAG TPA: deoxyhypusine synthase family protein, partial [Thermoanaerobaculia bacterium]|nr:deoxyhypusine synthase family protein [Thermoanaerobaculia bacterium]
IRGYTFDIQIVSAPITEGSLSSCPPAEAVTWGKVDRDTYQQTTESVQADYSMVMPFLVKALLDKREAYARRAQEIGEEALFKEDPQAAGYLRSRDGYRLFENRDPIVRQLAEKVRENGEWLLKTLKYPLASERE